MIIFNLTLSTSETTSKINKRDSNDSKNLCTSTYKLSTTSILPERL